MKRRKNPLRRRIIKELTGDWKKYLVVFLFLSLTIGFISGMYVANGSMMTSIEEGNVQNKLEDGHFELKRSADASLLAAIEAGEKADLKTYFTEKIEGMGLKGRAAEVMAGALLEQAEKEGNWYDPDSEPVPVSVYENFFRNEEEDQNGDGEAEGEIRVYKQTDEINLASLLKGRFPENESEIALDRMHAANAGIKVGDTIHVSGVPYEVVGLLAYVNYVTLHEKVTDMMFDALKFNVAMVTEEGFDRLPGSVHYAYAWRYPDRPADLAEEKKWSDALLNSILTLSVTTGNEIADYLPQYANPAIHFATDDIGKDKTMGGVLLNILIVIIAFIFAVTISNTIAKEASAIGTLRASGYTKGEIARHYLTVPVLVMLFAAIAGNLLGYTLLKQAVVAMYYNSYSMPAYRTVWSPEALLKTTIIPVFLMLVVNAAVIARMMQFSPLAFLRHDLKKHRRKKTMRLPAWSFIRRFRMRIILENIPNYLILFAGVFFIALMLAMAVGMLSTLRYYQANASDMMFSNYQYVLKDYKDESGHLLATDHEDAESFALQTLIREGSSRNEEISVYGVVEDSRYIVTPGLQELAEDEVYISEPYAEKFDVNVGDRISLKEQYENVYHEFTVAGITEQKQSIAVFMPIEHFRTCFDLQSDAFTGYFADKELTDLDEQYVAAVITQREITKMADQLDHSMGAYMQYFQVLCILLATILLYLLTKIIIEKNETAISMTKILGYEDREIAGLYLYATTAVLLTVDLLSTLLAVKAMGFIWKQMFMEYSGWIEFYMKPVGFLQIFGFILLGYLLVLFFDYQRIRRIPLEEALKAVE
ncbi:MAG: ABC transporter permease [Lachnospiraceae bacterium]|nr:ABC transporter permease [Lachnospiraceae bacterium]